MEPTDFKIGAQLKKLRAARGLSLDEAAAVTGVSKPMLGQIERGQSVPTVTTLWKIATGFKVPFSSFLAPPQPDYALAGPQPERALREDGGRMRAYPLFSYDPLRSVEVFYIEFDAGCAHPSGRHSDGVEEYIFVLRGRLQLVLNGKAVVVEEKQALRFRADVPHAYNNPFDSPCSVYNTIFYPRAD